MNKCALLLYTYISVIELESCVIELESSAIQLERSLIHLRIS